MNYLQEIIHRMQPYPKELKEICIKNPDFADAIKTIHSGKFVSLGGVVVSYPLNSTDQVIGFYIYDYSKNIPKLKQDFIVNVGNKNKDFIIYTAYSKTNLPRLIQNINILFDKYPTYNRTDHHPKKENLSKELKECEERAWALVLKIKDMEVKRTDLTLEEYKKYDFELKNLGL
jgi:hypothetical protein